MPNNKRIRSTHGAPRLLESIILHTKHGDKYRLNIPDIAEFIENTKDMLWMEDPSEFYDLLSAISDYTLDADMPENLEKTRVRCLRFLKALELFLPTFFVDIRKEEDILIEAGLA